MSTRVAEEHDAGDPIVRRTKITAVNHASMHTVIEANEGTIITDEPVQHGGTGKAATPLETVLAALCGCESVTFNKAAKEFGFDYERIDFEAEFTLDLRGLQGNRNVRPHFQTVRMQATVHTDEPLERLEEIVEETEARCPVYNLINDAGVDVQTVWLRRESDASSD